MFKFSKMSWATFISFSLGIICIMFNCLWTPMIYPALVLLATGFVLLAITLTININKKNKDLDLAKEELLMELSVTDEGEQYVLKNSSTSKKYRRKLRMEKFNRYIPVIVSYIMAGLMVFLLVKFIFKF